MQLGNMAEQKYDRKRHIDVHVSCLTQIVYCRGQRCHWMDTGPKVIMPDCLRLTEGCNKHFGQLAFIEGRTQKVQLCCSDTQSERRIQIWAKTGCRLAGSKALLVLQSGTIYQKSHPATYHQHNVKQGVGQLLL
jgi:hypothetical protein